MVASYIFAGLSLILCTVFCIFRTKKASVLSLMLKTFASISFVFCGLCAIQTSTSINLLILAGLIMGLIGDILLDLKIMYPKQNNQYFIAGTSVFALGHIFYFLAVLFYNIEVLPNNVIYNILASIGVALILTIAIMFSSKKMGLKFGKMLWVVIIYSFVLTFMMSYSVSIAIFNPIFWIFACGMITFFLSDLVLSMQYFGGREEKVWIYVNHILYYIAQVLLALSIIYLM